MFFRYGCFKKLLEHIDQNEGGVEQFSRGYETFGIHRMPDNSIYMKEWAPGAKGLALRGEFSMSITFYLQFALKVQIHVLKIIPLCKPVYNRK